MLIVVAGLVAWALVGESFSADDQKIRS